MTNVLLNIALFIAVAVVVCCFAIFLYSLGTFVYEDITGKTDGRPYLHVEPPAPPTPRPVQPITVKWPLPINCIVIRGDVYMLKREYNDSDYITDCDNCDLKEMCFSNDEPDQDKYICGLWWDSELHKHDEAVRFVKLDNNEQTGIRKDSNGGDS